MSDQPNEERNQNEPNGNPHYSSGSAKENSNPIDKLREIEQKLKILGQDISANLEALKNRNQNR